MHKKILEKIKQSIPLSQEELVVVHEMFSPGLRWEEKQERCERALMGGTPVFEEVVDHSIMNGAQYPTHQLIEGENLYSLMVLEKTHRSKVDIIYIALKITCSER